jgi:hypothetical protein
VRAGLIIKLRFCPSVEKTWQNLVATGGLTQRHSQAVAGIKATPRNSRVNGRKQDCL